MGGVEINVGEEHFARIDRKRCAGVVKEVFVKARQQIRLMGEGAGNGRRVARNPVPRVASAGQRDGSDRHAVIGPNHIAGETPDAGNGQEAEHDRCSAPSRG